MNRFKLNNIKLDMDIYHKYADIYNISLHSMVIFNMVYMFKYKTGGFYDFSTGYYYIPITAIMFGRLDIVRFLVSLSPHYKVMLDYDRNSGLCNASIRGHLDMVKYLSRLPKRYGIKLNDNSNRVILNAYHNDHKEVVRFLFGFKEVRSTLEKADYVVLERYLKK